MMRIVVLVLVAANLLFLVWSRTSGDDAARLTEVAADAAAAPPPATVAATPAGPPPCATIGPFNDELLADQARQQLESAGWGLVRRASIEESGDGWWVYVATDDAQAQSRALNAIRNAGMRDAFAMPDDAEHRVSVGIFSVESRAEDRAAQVQRLRFEARVLERRKQVPVIWFDVPGVARETLSDGRLVDTGLPLDRLRVEQCPAAEPVPAALEATAEPVAEAAAP